MPIPVFAPPAADPVFAPLPAALAAPDPEEPERGRSELWVARTGPPVVAPASAPAAPTGSVVQFLNMNHCWPSVHRLVVTQ